MRLLRATFSVLAICLGLATSAAGAAERTRAIGGPDAFVMVAKDFESFGDPVVTKMIVAVADLG